MSKREIGYWVASLSLVFFGIVHGASSYAHAQRRGDPKPVVTWEQVPCATALVPVGALALVSPDRMGLIEAVAAGRLAHPTWGNQYWDAGTPGNAYSHFKQQHNHEEAWQLASDMAFERIVEIADGVLLAAGE
ncbi:hypothetical protein LCGC14_1893170 [marine sediment metagenome]|uniref:Uncharacterized protein n=2 Tax=marine sediment metagenome TaxID=412755 RepID=A0A0F9ICN7_9ZZZZ